MRERSTLEIHLQPGAKSSGLVGFRNGVLYARVTAPPEKGRANKALLELIAGELRVSKSDLEIVRGHTSRHKVIYVMGLAPEELSSRIARFRVDEE